MPLQKSVYFTNRKLTFAPLLPKCRSMMRRRVSASFHEATVKQLTGYAVEGGLVEANSDPDIYVAYYAATSGDLELTLRDLEYAYGPGFSLGSYWKGGIGTRDVTKKPFVFKEGTVVVDIWDRERKVLVWRGMATTVLKKDYNVDKTRIWPTGHSRGGGMSVILPFLAPTVFAGFCGQAAFSGVNAFDAIIADWTGPWFAAVLLHGTLDDNVQPKEYHTTVAALAKGGFVTAEELAKEGKSTDAASFLPYFVPNQGHRWQPDISQEWFDFLYARPLLGGK